ncbi:PRC-barrel domain-containing protein [Methylocystis sp.]|uniref:PRC-barrel domain-containing protein n=1 Tax=Methylocystis sp. TaxID=1911079 RepID=UPI003DA38859
MATAASNPKINLISSQHIDGAAVYDKSGKEIGKIDHFMIDMESGRVLYAVVEFCGFMCLHPGHHPLPWTSLKYDRDCRGYFADVTQDLVESAPDYTDESWMDREWETRVHQHYAAQPYWQESGGPSVA